MKVADVMKKDVDFVSIEAKVEDVSHLIFGRGINGVPVCREKKVVGFVTERDILSKFYPSMQEFIEDPVHASNFEDMEQRVAEILSLPVKEIMSTNPTTVTAETPLLRAQSLMFVRKVGRLPVLDEKGNLIGIISKGDIFKTIVSEKLALGEEEKFYDWLAKYYDIIYDWEKRIGSELPELITLFKGEKVKTILDVASSTGEHSLALARKGFSVFGIEASELMHETSQKKRAGLPERYKSNVRFFKGPYQEILKDFSTKIDAAVFLGNALPHVIYTDKEILKDMLKVLREKNPIMIFQLTNYEKIFKVKDGLRHFMVVKHPKSSLPSHVVCSFYNKEKNRKLVATSIILNFVGGKWVFRGIKSTPLLQIGKQEISGLLQKLGFSNLKFYGGAYNGSLFKEPFKPLESDWLNVVAKR